MLDIPTNCPACGSELIRENDQLFCTYIDCDAQSSKKLRHFAKTMKIMGLGAKTIEKLEILSIEELYNLTYDDILSSLDSEKLANKLIAEIEKSKQPSLETFIVSLGIPLVGKSVSKKLAEVVTSLWDVDAKACNSAGLGEKVTANLLQWLEDNAEKYKQLPITITKKEPTAPVAEHLFTVCITGKLKEFASRAKAKEYLEPLGISVLGAVSSKIDYLVCDAEDSASSSYKKAEKLGKPIITMNELKKYINKET